MNNPVIEFKNFSLKYAALQTKTLDNINLTILKGEKVLVIGRSGSGKSTLLHCINAIVPFSLDAEINGSLRVCDIEPAKQSIFKVSKYVGTILQDQDAQFIGTSVGEDVAFSMENNCVNLKEMKSKVSECLNMVDMANFIDKSPYELSGGQKQKVALAGVMTSSPEILVFDEPLANLDPASAKNVISLISQINKEFGKTILIAEHRIEEALDCGIDKVVVFDKGRIIQIATPAEVLSSGILTKLGIREPLYVDIMKFAGIEISKKQVSSLETSMTSMAEEDKSMIVDFCRSNKESMESAANKSISCIKLEDISFSYEKKGRQVLKNISFDIKSGEIISILGNNGSGKSTLSMIISGMLKPSSGKIYFQGKDITQLGIKQRGQIIGLVMQNPNSMIVKEMIKDEIGLGLQNLNTFEYDSLYEKKINDVLKICDLWPYRNWPISAISYGQKKRVTIASILALDPKVIIMDEPTAGQDYLSYINFMNLVKKLANKGVSIIVITHDMYLAMEFSDRSIVISDGEKLSEGEPYSVFADYNVMKKANLKDISLNCIADKIGLNRKTVIKSFIDKKRGML